MRDALQTLATLPLVDLMDNNKEAHPELLQAYRKELDTIPTKLQAHEGLSHFSATTTPGGYAVSCTGGRNGSTEWARIYFRLRNSIEGLNGFAKDPVHEAIEAGATRRIRGIAPASILLAFQLHHVNTRKLAIWADTQPGNNGDPPRRRPSRRRETKPLGTWSPAGHINPVPQAA